MNPFLRYLADKNSAHTQTDTQTDRHTPLTTIPDGLRRAGNYCTQNVATKIRHSHVSVMSSWYFFVVEMA